MAADRPRCRRQVLQGVAPLKPKHAFLSFGLSAFEMVLDMLVMVDTWTERGYEA